MSCTGKKQRVLRALDNFRQYYAKMGLNPTAVFLKLHKSPAKRTRAYV